MKGLYILSACTGVLLTTSLTADESYPPPAGPYTSFPSYDEPFSPGYPPNEQAYNGADYGYPMMEQGYNQPDYGYPTDMGYPTQQGYYPQGPAYPAPINNQRALSFNPGEVMNGFSSPWQNIFGNGNNYPQGYGYEPEYSDGYYPQGDGYPPSGHGGYNGQGYGPGYGDYRQPAYPMPPGYDDYRYPNPPAESGYGYQYQAPPYGASGQGAPLPQRPLSDQWNPAPLNTPADSAGYGYTDDQAPTLQGPGANSFAGQQNAPPAEVIGNHLWRPLTPPPTEEGKAAMMPNGLAPVFRPLSEEEQMGD